MGVSPRNAKSNMTERKIYEILGVRLFRKAVMAFERLRHKKDGGTNSNYHPKNDEYYGVIFGDKIGYEDGKVC